MSHEGSKLDPWTTLAQFHLKAEHELEKIDGLVSLSPPPPPPPPLSPSFSRHIDYHIL